MEERVVYNITELEGIYELQIDAFLTDEKKVECIKKWIWWLKRKNITLTKGPDLHIYPKEQLISKIESDLEYYEDKIKVKQGKEKKITDDLFKDKPLMDFDEIEYELKNYKTYYEKKYYLIRYKKWIVKNCLPNSNFTLWYKINNCTTISVSVDRIKVLFHKIDEKIKDYTKKIQGKQDRIDTSLEKYETEAGIKQKPPLKENDKIEREENETGLLKKK